MSSAPQQPKHDAESQVKRNPHPDFKKVEASRPDWTTTTLKFTKTQNPDWTFGKGANDGGASLEKEHVEIDPYEEGRPAVYNYKLLISAIVPRPIGFCSTISADGKLNLAPFSYFNVINHDPPLFIFGFSGGFDNGKDSLANLAATRQCTVNIISEHFLEAANASSIDAPAGVSEWPLTGLHPAPASVVRAPRVAEAVFSAECTLESTREFESRRTKGKKTGVLAVVEGVRFWVRGDAINDQRNLIDPAVLTPVSRLGGISYGRLTEAVELPRPVWEEEMRKGALEGVLDGNGSGGRL